MLSTSPSAVDIEQDLEEQRKREMPSDMLSRMHYARQYRSSLVPMWDACFEFLRGNQWVTTDRSRISAAIGHKRVRSISNRLLPIYRSSCSMLRAQFPRFTVDSMSPSYDDMVKRIAADYTLSAWWKMNRMEHRWDEVIRWLSPGGNAALWTYFDPHAEKVCTETISTYDIIWEADALSTDEADWAAVRRVITRGDAIKRWPEHEKFLEKMPSSLTQDGYEREMMPRDRLEFWYVYMKDGRCGVWMGCNGNRRQETPSKSQWLEESETPDGIFPIAFMRWTPIADRLYGMSQLWPLLDMQVQYNLYRNFMLESVKLMSNPIWLLPKQANVDRNQITNRPGQAVYFNGNSVPPTRLPGPSLSSDVYDVQNRQLMEMEDVGGIHNISMGKRAPGVTAGIAQQQLQSGDMAALDLTMREMQRAMEECATHALVYWKAYMPERKSVKVLDPTFGVTVTKELRSTDIIDAPEVFVEAGSMFAISQKERDQQILQLAQLGVMPPDQVLKNLSFTVDEKSELEKMQMLSHAQDLLMAVLSGHQIELVEEPALLLAVRNVFGEYIRSPAFFDVYNPTTIQAAQMGDPDAENALQSAMNVKAVYQQVAQQMQMQQAAMQPQQGPTGSLAKGPDVAGQGAPSGPAARPALNDPMNPTAGAPESKHRTGMMAP